MTVDPERLKIYWRCFIMAQTGKNRVASEKSDPQIPELTLL
jgi:hypothetical protein